VETGAPDVIGLRAAPPTQNQPSADAPAIASNQTKRLMKDLG
jgi:hypothetical protein